MAQGAFLMRGCEGKARFSEDDATTRVDEANRNQSRRKQKKRAFLCPNCGFWHIGTSRKRSDHVRSGSW